MEKKAEVLNSLSLSPLSETQRERERERAQTIDDFIPATLVTVARRRRRFLRFSERERERERK
jgi:glutathione S-transferase